MIDDPNDPPRLALYNGVVVNRADPLKLGRVTVRIPGLVEPESGWCFPLSMARGRGQGFFDVPQVGAEVSVWFLLGDTDRPFYVPGHHVVASGVGQGPSSIQASDVTPEDAPDIRCWETERHLVLLDGRTGREALELRDKTTGDGVLYDGLTRILEVRGTVAVRIVSQGAITIDGLAVTINNRPVLPGAGPIR